MKDSIGLHKQFELNVYPKRDLVIVKGENARVWDNNGNEYIDCIGGHGVVSIGHCNSVIIDAINKQARTLINCPGTFYNDRRAELLEKLMEIAPPKLRRAFLCNSGTEAIEAAIKFARITMGKTDFVCAVRGFHGRTYGAMSATHEPKYQQGAEPLVPGFSFVPFNNFEKLKAAISLSTAAVILELVQGEGGVNIADKDYISKVRELCSRNNILLIVDEVQTGFCRTGKFFACEHFDLAPDIMCVAKAMAGGLPMGAVMCLDNFNIPVGKHGSTFGGNPLVCAASIATIEFMKKEKLFEQAGEKGKYFFSQFPAAKLKRVREVRQIGLMIGIELKEKSQPLLIELMNRKVLALPAGPNVIRLLPPLTISLKELDTVIEKLTEVLN